MHPIVLGTAGYTLILTSLVSIVVLLRKNVRRCVTSSLHALTMSDILSSIVTGVLLILNQYNQPTAGPFGTGENGPNAAGARGWTKFVGSLGILETNSTRIENPHDSSCDFKSIAMHYAMFIFPFANAFVSLLSFSARASLDIDRVSSRCERITGSTCSSLNENGRDYSREEKNDCNRKKKNEVTVIGLGLIGQWIVPALLTAVVQLAGQQRIDGLRSSSDMECVYGINFPFDNCHNLENTMIEDLTNSVEYTTPSVNDYIGSIDSSRISGENSSSEFDDVVSKISAIVGSVMNSTGHGVSSTRAPSHYEVSELADITRIMESISSNGEDKKEPNIHIVESSEDNLDYSNEEEQTTIIDELDPVEEIKLFESLLNNSTEFSTEKTESSVAEAEPEDDYLDDSTSLEDDFTTERTEQEKTDDEIYADIVKKIHAVSTQLRGREKVHSSRENTTARSKKNSIAYENHREDTLVCANSECFMSTRFLKIHLLVILFVVYFLPILASAILQTRARYACLRVKEKIVSTVGKEDSDETKKSNASVEKIDRAEASGWFPAVVTNEHEISASSSEDLVRASRSQEPNYSVSDTSEQPTKVDSVLLRSIEDETLEGEKISDLFGTSMLLAVLLWSPIFLQILSKVFLCVDPGDMLMNSSFFVAALFGAARNILDLRMIRTTEIIRKDGKRNTICPGS